MISLNLLFQTFSLFLSIFSLSLSSFLFSFSPFLRNFYLFATFSPNFTYIYKPKCKDSYMCINYMITFALNAHYSFLSPYLLIFFLFVLFFSFTPFFYRVFKMGHPAQPSPPRVGHLVNQPNPTHLLTSQKHMNLTWPTTS